MALPAYQSIGTVGTGSTSVTPGLPASLATGDGVLIMVVTKPDTATINTPSGWTLVADVAGGGGINGNGTGPTRQAWFFREKDAGWSTMPAISITNGNSSAAIAMRYTKTAGSVWDIAAATGTFGSGGTVTNCSATMGSNPGLRANDAVAAGLSNQDDLPTWGGGSVTATGVSAWGTFTERSEVIETTTGFDVGGMLFTGSVTTGTATDAPVVNATANTATRGTTVLVRLREIEIKSGSESISLAVSESANTMPPIKLNTFNNGLDLGNITVANSGTSGDALSAAGTSNTYSTEVTIRGTKVAKLGVSNNGYLTMAVDQPSEDIAAYVYFYIPSSNTGAARWNFFITNNNATTAPNIEMWLNQGGANPHFVRLLNATQNGQGSDIPFNLDTVYKLGLRLRRGTANNDGWLVVSLHDDADNQIDTQFSFVGNAADNGSYTTTFNSITVQGTNQLTTSMYVDDLMVNNGFQPYPGTEGNNVSKSASESNSLAVTDSSSSLLTSSQTDSMSLAVTETTSILNTSTATDSMSLAVTETASVAISISATDSMALSVSDTSQLTGTANVSASDSASISVSDQSSTLVDVSLSTGGAAEEVVFVDNDWETTPSGTTVSSRVVTIPNTASAGEMAIVIGDVNQSSAALDITATNTWTALEATRSPSTTLSVRVWYRVLTESDILTNVTVSVPTAGRLNAGLVIVGPSDGPPEWTVSDTGTTSTGSNPQTIAAIDPTDPSLVLAIGGFRIPADAGGASTFVTTPPTGWTERLDINCNHGSGARTGLWAATLDGTNTSANVASTTFNADWVATNVIYTLAIPQAPSSGGQINDSIGLSVSDVASVEDIVQGAVGSESNSLSVSETSSVLVEVSSSDTAALSVAEAQTSESGLSVSETIGLAVSETPAVSATVTASDTLSVALNDISSAAPSVPGTETTALSVTETTSILVTMSRTDNASVSVSDASATQANFSTTDTGNITVTEAVAPSVNVSVTDTSSIATSESVVTNVSVSVTDTSSLAVTEASSPTTYAPGSETIALAVTDTSSILVSISSTDSCAFGLNDTASAVSTQPQVASDSSAISVSESTTLVVSTSASDTAALSVADASTTHKEITSSDNLIISVSDTSSTAVSLSSTDTASLTVGETSSISSVVTSSDTAAISVSESTAANVSASSTDTLSLALTESSSAAGTAPGQETTALGVVETTSILVTFTRTDTSSLSVSESTNISADSGLTSSEFTDLIVTETSSVSATTTSADTASLSVSETRAVLVSITASDTMSIAVAENTVGYVETTSADGASITLSESTTQDVSLSSSDTFVVLLTDNGTAADTELSMAVWRNGEWVTGSPVVYHNGQWVPTTYVVFKNGAWQ